MSGAGACTPERSTWPLQLRKLARCSGSRSLAQSACAPCCGSSTAARAFQPGSGCGSLCLFRGVSARGALLCLYCATARAWPASFSCTAASNSRAARRTANSARPTFCSRRTATRAACCAVAADARSVTPSPCCSSETHDVALTAAAPAEACTRIVSGSWYAGARRSAWNAAMARRTTRTHMTVCAMLPRCCDCNTPEAAPPSAVAPHSDSDTTLCNAMPPVRPTRPRYHLHQGHHRPNAAVVPALSAVRWQAQQMRGTRCRPTCSVSIAAARA